MERNAGAPGGNAAVWEYRLVVVLRLIAGFTALAVLAVFMPTSWMAMTHERLGLGPFPEGAIVLYLARTLSAFYTAHAGLVWLVSTDVRRFSPIITYIIWVALILGIAFPIVDATAGLPLYWTLGEGLSILTMCVVLLILKRLARV